MKRRNFFTSLAGVAATVPILASVNKTSVKTQDQIEFQVVQNSLDERGHANIVITWPDTKLKTKTGQIVSVVSGKLGWLNLTAGQYYFYWRVSIDPLQSKTPIGHVALASENQSLPYFPSAHLALKQGEDGWMSQHVLTVQTPMPPTSMQVHVQAYDAQAFLEWAKANPDCMSQAILYGLQGKA